MIGFACVENAFAARGGTLTIQWADDWGRPLGKRTGSRCGVSVY